MIRPKPRARMPGSARRVRRTMLRNIASNCATQVASAVSATAPGGGPPVLSTRMSTAASATARLAIAVASLRSQARTLILPRPGAPAAASSFRRSRLRATAMTFAPSARQFQCDRAAQAAGGTGYQGATSLDCQIHG